MLPGFFNARIASRKREMKMKCVCPMGGDRTCPNDCPLAVWANLSLADRKAQRKSVAERLYKQHFTMEQIATQLGVSHPTIVRDLEEFVHDEQIKTSKTASNPKGAGRPKGSGKTSKMSPEVAEAVATAILDEGKSEDEVRKETGAGVQGIRLAVSKEQGRREAVPKITPDMLSMSAQEKLQAAIRQHKKNLDVGFAEAVQRECQKQMNELWLPHCQERLDKAAALLQSRTKGVMPRSMFRKILACLHPDSRKSASEERLNEVFRNFEKLETILCSETEMPTPKLPFPRTWEKAQEMKRKVSETRKAKRQGNGLAT